MSKLTSTPVRRRARRLVLDMPFRNDAFLNDNVFTSIVHSENRGSILSMMGWVLGDNIVVNEQSDPMFEIKPIGLASNYIKIKEVCEKREPLRVVENSRVPDVIIANQHIIVGLKGPVLDPDEFVHLRDEYGFARVISRRPTTDGSAEYTLQMSGIPGVDTFNGSHLFEVGAPVNHRFGNSKGEASTNSNLLSADAQEFNTFYNPMPITRYKLPVTGDFMSDEMITVASAALDGSSDEEYNTGMSRKWFRQVLEAMEKSVLYSTANFNPQTYEIGGQNTNSSYPERPHFAGILQQMDQANFKFNHSYGDTNLSGLNKINRIMQTIMQMPGSSKTIFAMCRGTAAEWLRGVIREGALAAQSIRIQINQEADKITTGFVVEKYMDGYGNLLYIYDYGKNMIGSTGDYDLTSYNGMKGTPRGNDIFFFSGTTAIGGGGAKKVAKLFSKEGQGFGDQKVNRGFVFGVSKGITGAGNGMTGAGALQMQQDAFEQVIRNASRYQVQSLVDGDEYHVLWQNCPYIDPRGICKLHLSK